MRSLTLWTLVLMGCATSSQDLVTAKKAVYEASPQQIFAIAEQAATESYKIGEVDEGHLRFATVPRFYSETGDLESAGAGGVVQIRPKSVMVTLIVEVIPVSPRQVAVRVTPQTFQQVPGSPKPRELRPDDPYLPPWVLGRADALTYAIYERGKPYVLAPPGAP